MYYVYANAVVKDLLDVWVHPMLPLCSPKLFKFTQPIIEKSIFLSDRLITPTKRLLFLLCPGLNYQDITKIVAF